MCVYKVSSGDLDRALAHESIFLPVPQILFFKNQFAGITDAINVEATIQVLELVLEHGRPKPLQLQ